MKTAFLTLWKNIPFRQLVPVFAMGFMLVLACVEPTYAQNFDAIQKVLDTVVKAATGPLGTAIASIAVIAVGITFMMGRMDWMFAVAIILGIAIMFGAANIIQGMGGGG